MSRCAPARAQRSSIGEARPLVADALTGAVDVHAAATLDEAVSTAFELAKPDGVVLLAPACASFDMFRDYADRGRRFKEAARENREESGSRRGRAVSSRQSVVRWMIGCWERKLPRLPKLMPSPEAG